MFVYVSNNSNRTVWQPRGPVKLTSSYLQIILPTLTSRPLSPTIGHHSAFRFINSFGYNARLQFRSRPRATHHLAAESASVPTLIAPFDQLLNQGRTDCLCSKPSGRRPARRFSLKVYVVLFDALYIASESAYYPRARRKHARVLRIFD